MIMLSAVEILGFLVVFGRNKQLEAEFDRKLAEAILECSKDLNETNGAEPK